MNMAIILLFVIASVDNMKCKSYLLINLHTYSSNNCTYDNRIRGMHLLPAIKGMQTANLDSFNPNTETLYWTLSSRIVNLLPTLHHRPLKKEHIICCRPLRRGGLVVILGNIYIELNY